MLTERRFHLHWAATRRFLGAPCWSDLHNLDQFVLKSNKWIIDTAHANNISAKPVDSLQRVAPETPAPQGAHHPPPPPAKFKSKHFNT